MASQMAKETDEHEHFNTKFVSENIERIVFLSVDGSEHSDKAFKCKFILVFCEPVCLTLVRSTAITASQL